MTEWFLMVPFLTLLSSLSGDSELRHRFDGDFWVLGWAVEMLQVKLVFFFF